MTVKIIQTSSGLDCTGQILMGGQSVVMNINIKCSQRPHTKNSLAQYPPPQYYLMTRDQPPNNWLISLSRDGEFQKFPKLLLSPIQGVSKVWDDLESPTI